MVAVITHRITTVAMATGTMTGHIMAVLTMEEDIVVSAAANIAIAIVIADVVAMDTVMAIAGNTSFLCVDRGYVASVALFIRANRPFNKRFNIFLAKNRLVCKNVVKQL